MSVFSVVNAFNAGELSPLLLARPDLEQYSRGCRVLENFLPTPYGTAERRPGTQLMHAFRYADGEGAGRLMRFSYDANNTYLLLFTPTSLYVFKPGTRNGWLSPCVITGGDYPWAGKDLDAIVAAQLNDVMCIVHPDVAPQRLARTGDMSFTLGEWPFSVPPFLDWNTNGNWKLSVTATALGATGTLTASGSGFSPFKSSWVGRRVVLRTTKGSNRLEGSFTSNGTSGEIYVNGAWTLTTHGSWIGSLEVQRKGPDDASFATFLQYSSNNDYNVAVSGDEAEEGVKFRLQMSGYSEAPSGTNKRCGYLLSAPQTRSTGVVRITGRTSNTQVSVVVEKAMYFGQRTSTSDWAWGAFSGATGYPRAVCFHQQRLWLGGTQADPQRLWGSRVDGYDDFQPLGGEEDSAMDLTLTGGDASCIAWLASKDALLAGTMDEEWSIAPSNGAQGALTSENLYIRRTSAYGSAWPPCTCLAEDRMVFAQRDRERLRSMVYSWEQDGYVAEDLTLLAEHVTRPGVRCLAVQKSPDTVVWCALEDGTLASCTCDSSQRVNGWARHPRSAGEVLSLCVLPTPSGEDRLYLLTLLNGWLCLERMFPRRFPGFGEAVFLDMAMPVIDGIYDGEALCFTGVALPGTVSTDVAGLFAGLSPGMLSAGREYAEGAWDDESDLSAPAGFDAAGGWLGLPYASVLSPMPAEMQTQRGLSMLRQKTVCRMLVDTYGTIGGEVRADEGKWQTLLPRDVSDDVEVPPEGKDEVVVSAPMGGHARRTKVEIRQTLPLPINVAGLALELSSEGV
ncbi:MAG: hypothetical protein II943_00430 [Victivallales bacterium]|nr:hypothetical protein [Victivallales bacterium]